MSGPHHHSPAAISRGNQMLSPELSKPSGAKILRFTPHQAGSMRGFLSVELPSGMVVNDLKLMIGPTGKPWLAMPSQKQVDRDGTPRLDANGKQTYTQFVEFANRSAADRFRHLVLAAFRQQHPEALAGEVNRS
jgi:DNA-binding cell septation regulator SpoVG